METFKPRGPDMGEGHYKFTISSPPTKKKVGERGFILYTVEMLIHGTSKLTSFNFPAWEIEPLLNACGFTPSEDGTIVWEPEDMQGHEIEGDVVYEVSKKDPMRKYKKLINIQEALKF